MLQGFSLNLPRRRPARTVRIGPLRIGSDHPVLIQSMTVSDTMDTDAVVSEIRELVDAGCPLVRLTAPSVKHAENLREIRRRLASAGLDVPMVADIHFTPNAALIAAEIVEKVRINPGNFADRKKFAVREYTDREYAEDLERVAETFRPLVRKLKENGAALRIGTNHGSLSDRIMNRYGDTPAGMVESALEFVGICEAEGYRDIVLSMKSSIPSVMIAAYRLLVRRMDELGMDYPLHLGVTEAGDGLEARIKSAAGIGSLLVDGIGDTIRVSLAEDSRHEIPAARAILEAAERELGRRGTEQDLGRPLQAETEQALPEALSGGRSESNAVPGDPRVTTSRLRADSGTEPRATDDSAPSGSFASGLIGGSRPGVRAGVVGWIDTLPWTAGPIVSTPTRRRTSPWMLGELGLGGGFPVRVERRLELCGTAGGDRRLEGLISNPSAGQMDRVGSKSGAGRSAQEANDPPSHPDVSGSQEGAASEFLSLHFGFGGSLAAINSAPTPGRFRDATKVDPETAAGEFQSPKNVDPGSAPGSLRDSKREPGFPDSEFVARIIQTIEEIRSRDVFASKPILLEAPFAGQGEIHWIEAALPHVDGLSLAVGADEPSSDRVRLMARLLLRLRKPVRWRLAASIADPGGLARRISETCRDEGHDALGFLLEPGPGWIPRIRAVAGALGKSGDLLFLEVPALGPDPALLAGSALLDGLGDAICLRGPALGAGAALGSVPGPKGGRGAGAAIESASAGASTASAAGRSPVDHESALRARDASSPWPPGGRSWAEAPVASAFAILQACRLRLTKVEFIACPSCGRTQFDLQTVTGRVRSRTDHLVGVKIAVMGCIVNGPGEMADADFGYVGSGPGRVDLYVGKDRVRQAVPETEAAETLVQLIREHGRWIEPPADPHGHGPSVAPPGASRG